MDWHLTWLVLSIVLMIKTGASNCWQRPQKHQPQLQPQLNKTQQIYRIGKCVEYCDVKYYRELPCVESSGRYSSSPAAECSRYCEPEEFEHCYMLQKADGSIVQQRHRNRFLRTRGGDVAIMHDLCLSSSGLPVTRMCTLRRGVGVAAWQYLGDVTCLATPQYELSQQLNKLHNEILSGGRRLNSTQGRHDAVAVLRGILRQPERQLLPVDVLMTEKIFEALSEEKKDAALRSDLLSVVSAVMATDATVLRLSAELNATNGILHNFETYMDALPQQLVPRESCDPVGSPTSSGSDAVSGVETISYVHIGVQALITSNLSVFFVNPTCDHITGIAIYGTPAPQLLSSSSGFWYRFLRANESMEALRVDPALEAATFLPELLWQAVHGAGATYLVFKVYAHDALFVETTAQRMRRPRSKVLSISIPDFADVLPQPLPFLLRNENYRKPDAAATQSGCGCGYWNYKTWLRDGVMTTRDDMISDQNVVCHAQHLTQFAFLIGGSYSQPYLRDIVLVKAPAFHEQILDHITVVGCCLSLFGLFGIWMTAIVAKSWRSQASTKLLLHLCAALTFQMVLYLSLRTDALSEHIVLNQDFGRCTALGAALQYSVLVVFTWMLIIALLQFKRYVTVIGVQYPRHYILILAVVAWMLPLLPTLLLVYLDPTSYIPTQYQLNTHTAICYPSGYGLLFAVLLPIAMVTTANIVMVGCISYSVARALIPNRQLIVKQLRLSVMLFFLLGLTWIFGMFSYMRLGIVFSYLFCLTATLQGFMLFVYFVVQDQNARHAWRTLLVGGYMTYPVQSLSMSTSQSVVRSRNSNIANMDSSN